MDLIIQSLPGTYPVGLKIKTVQIKAGRAIEEKSPGENSPGVLGEYQPWGNHVSPGHAEDNRDLRGR